MSILVALKGCDSALVATDSRCIGPDGTVDDGVPKTFRLPAAWAIGGHTGLLRFSGRTIPQWLETLPFATISMLDDLAKATKCLFESQMQSISPTEVGFTHRRLDVTLVGHSMSGLLL